jgi:ABC-type branched-subunit amino acid transport system ATPase component
VLFTEHSMDVVFTYAHRVLVMARGRIIAQGKPAQVRDDPQVQAVYLGTGASFAARATLG